MQTYQTRDGDTVDEISWRQYGVVNAVVLRTVLEANRGLADYGPRLPAGVIVTFPDIAQPKASEQGIALWTE